MTMTDTPRTATDPYAPTVVTLTADQFASIASATVAAAPVKELTPIIQAVQVGIEAGILTAVATDRYRVARITFPIEGAPDLEPVTIPRTFLDGFAKSIRAAKLPATSEITLTVTPTEPSNAYHDPAATLTLASSYAGVSATASALQGNYPPVARLFPETLSDTPSPEISLNLARLADAEKLTHPALTATAIKASPGMRIRYTTSDNPAKPGPILVDHGARIKPEQGTLEYLLQPNMLLR
jgi:DNA polymerase-3 subunit beta